MKPSELVDKLCLSTTLTGHKWHIQAACASTGEGLYEAMESLSRMVKDHRRRQWSISWICRTNTNSRLCIVGLRPHAQPYYYVYCVRVYDSELPRSVRRIFRMIALSFVVNWIVSATDTWCPLSYIFYIVEKHYSVDEWASVRMKSIIVALNTLSWQTQICSWHSLSRDWWRMPQSVEVTIIDRRIQNKRNNITYVK